MRTRPDLSISIICTDNLAMLRDCLDSVFVSSDCTLEVFVVDNACTDGTFEEVRRDYPQVHLLRNQSRLGFSTNNNQAMGRAAGRYLMLLNDDTVVRAEALNRMIRFMDDRPSVGALGPRLLNADGSIQQSIGYSPRPLYEALQPLSSWAKRLDWKPRTPIEVEATSGACLMVRREVVEQVGLLDTRFDPIYSEEIDWCFRIRSAGWLIYHLPQAEVVHYGSQTMNRAPQDKMVRLLEKKALFFRKNLGSAAVTTFKFALLINCLAKAVCWAALTPVRGEGAATRARAHWLLAREIRRF